MNLSYIDFGPISDYFEHATPQRRLKALLALRGWSLEDLGKATGMTKQSWSHAMINKAFTAKQIVKLSNALGVSPSLFLPDDERPDGRYR